jgi:hypothetical protein
MIKQRRRKKVEVYGGMNLLEAKQKLSTVDAEDSKQLADGGMKDNLRTAESWTPTGLATSRYTWKKSLLVTVFIRAFLLIKGWCARRRVLSSLAPANCRVVRIVHRSVQ